MSRSDQHTEDVRNDQRSERRSLLGMVRWMRIAVTSSPQWQLLGVLLEDGVTRETLESLVFSGIGFYSRPRAGRNAEAGVVFAGAANDVPMIVATRDEDTRKQVAKIGEDETIVYNTQAALHVKAGTVLAYLVGHIADAVGLAKASELNNLRAFVMQQFSAPGHTHGVSGAVTNSVVPVIAPVVAPVTPYPGTTVLKGQ